MTSYYQVTKLFYTINSMAKYKYLTVNEKAFLSFIIMKAHKGILFNLKAFPKIITKG